MSKPSLPHFQEAVKPYAGTLPTGTYWRYSNGVLPSFGRMLIKHPELAEALAADARALATGKHTTPSSEAGDD